ncbi:immunity protein Imm33 domain-containing protein [Leuconostoc gasicomitatum]|uniref:immunity protein Imm33 domain-containing protein n=1 Tax=Leuconostoc gasicomitatum TaxID=115778 RepID=UPI001CC34B03|nr:DUF2185 domain-containing protein [Leuconostoc gasicomitatum]MBZ5961450.1 DUF2185 domain-containing protein [Leuconostoc gasicomitatum]MBZ5970575.1 DUF2185 domain-containing protein [Leuconostoc gasicomitatum]MBZ5993804.1 DUF2185 domain-containing protein [Leuconostoc gasicomitatum]MBZ5997172.1 DUF2185 domain-containing protein [Leuconostoc gasicomitatum]
MRSVFNQPEAVVLASKHLIDGTGNLRWIYRELAPTTSQDSGWLLFADNDTAQWNENSENFMPLVIETALAIEPSLINVLDLPYGTDLMLDKRVNVKGWWDPKTHTPVWLSDGTVTPNIEIAAGDVMENDSK